MSMPGQIDEPTTPDALNRKADRKTIQNLYLAGLLSAQARDEAFALLAPTPSMWWRRTSHMLLLLGAALTLAGIIFFFAYNWAKIGPFFKFWLIENFFFVVPTA